MKALLSRIQLPANSVCVSCICWQMGEVIMTDRPSVSNQQINTIVPNGKADPSFLYYSLRTRKEELLSLGAATGVRTPILNKSAFCDLKVKIPPLPLQRRIGGILSAYDELIENNVRRVRILEDMARVLYREWFVDFRFPGSEHGVISRAAEAIVPNGWRFAKLEAVAMVNRAQINTKAPPERVLYIDIASVGPGTVREVTFFAFEDAPGRARRVVQHGDILWSCVRPNRRSHVLILNPEPETVASTGFAVLTATKVPYTFLYQATTTDEFVGYVTNHATGAAYPAVTARTFQDAEILLPPGPLLSQFAELTVPQAELIAVLQRQNVNLRQTRDLLIPRLLSSQLSLAEIEDNPALVTESVAAHG